MPTNEQQIRALIERPGPYTAATSKTRPPTTSATSSVFDVPPLDDGVRGIDAYRETLAAVLRMAGTRGFLEIVELAVTAGDDVAYAHALLRCGCPRSTERPERACG